MDIKESQEIIKHTISEILKQKKIKIELSLNTNLVGGQSPIDSVDLVEICLALEDIALSKGFNFDWTSSSTLSQSQSMFKNIDTLSKEFLSQLEKQ